MSRQEIKKQVGYRAAEFVQEGMRVGLGTGSTAFFFIERLVQRCREENLRIEAVASSAQSTVLALQGNIPLIQAHTLTDLDLTVDGADEIDPLKRMIKGGGGAHVREKIIASMSREVIIVVDESKCVEYLGRCKLPVEVIPFAHLATLHRIERLGYHGEFRKRPDGSFFITDNGNHIIDIHFQSLRTHPEEDHEALTHLPGVVDTGFFFHLAHRVIVGYNDGTVRIL